MKIDVEKIVKEIIEILELYDEKTRRHELEAELHEYIEEIIDEFQDEDPLAGCVLCPLFDYIYKEIENQVKLKLSKGNK